MSPAPNPVLPGKAVKTRSEYNHSSCTDDKRQHCVPFTLFTAKRLKVSMCPKIVDNLVYILQQNGDSFSSERVNKTNCLET